MMKTETRKVHQNFKLDPKLDRQLKKEAEKTRRTQTAIVEMALESFLNVRRQPVAA